ncbi:Gfo/Idh/MocA family oxidoreductase [Paenibacillus sp. B2(2019)]|nr:Gfo/Idh/MocA family oxidoreductase [Paenibacillus sp. B2(2019)]
MKRYGAVVIGCGYMGSLHLDAISRQERVRLIGVADWNRDRASLVASQYGAECWSTDYRVLIERDDVDLVIIATYPSSHLEIAKDCLAAGKHILCEKPMAGNARETQEFMKLARGAKTKVLIGHILRHNTTYQAVMKMIREGAIGFPLVIRLSQLKPSKNWDSQLSLLRDVSPIVDCGVHYIDVMRWATGAEVVSVNGIGQRLYEEVPPYTYNYGLMTLRLSDGSIGYFETGWGKGLPTDNRKEFIGPAGRIRIIYKNDRPREDQHLGNLVEVEDHRKGTVRQINMDFSVKPTGAQLDYFLSMLENNLPAIPTMEDACRAMDIALLADRAIHEGITLPCAK